MYRDWEGFGKGENAVTVLHSCGHEVVYAYGGTADEYKISRGEFAERMKIRECHDCIVIHNALVGDVPDSEIPIVCSVEGRLTTIRGHVVVVSDVPWLVEVRDTEFNWSGEKKPYFIEYTYRTRVIPTDYLVSSYLHRRDGVEYTDAQEVFMREYIVRYHVESQCTDSRFYSIGQSWQFPGIWEDVEKRTGQKVYLTAPCDEHGNILQPGQKREFVSVDKTPYQKGDAGDWMFEEK